MFELIKNGKKDYLNICVNGVTYLYSHAYFDKGEIDKPAHYVSKDKIVSQYLLDCSLKDFGDFVYLSLNSVFDWVDFEHSLGISFHLESFGDYGKREYKKTGKIEVTFSFRPNLARWNKKFGFLDYYEEFENSFKHNKTLQGVIRYYSEDASSFDLTLVLPRLENRMSDFLLPYITEVKSIHGKAILNLQSKEYEGSIVGQFEFPNQIKAHCEQYLLYFAQFLQDLGINATSDLKEEAGKVLFSVTPTDDVEALDKIREALAVYLNLPASPIVYDDSFAAMRLQQQIRNLHHAQEMTVTELRSTQYALRLAQQNIENQENLLVRQSSLIEQQNKVIEKISSKSIMMDSAENKEELERVYDGLEVGHSKWLYEKTGIKANPIKSVKTAVQNIFGKDDETIIKLELNELTKNEDK